MVVEFLSKSPSRVIKIARVNTIRMTKSIYQFTLITTPLREFIFHVALRGVTRVFSKSKWSLL